MIERGGATLAWMLMAAAAAAAPQPVIWWLLGYPFEAASLMAAVSAAVTTRIVIGLRSAHRSWSSELAVLVLVLITTAAIVIGWRTNLVSGFLYGTGLATIGEGIIRIAERYTTKGLAVLGIEPPAPPGRIGARADDHDAAISDAIGKLNRVD